MAFRYMVCQRELDALSGLSWVPQLIYFRVIRPNMDFSTGFVGVPNGRSKAITYQLIRHEVQAKPVRGSTPSRDLSEKAIDNAIKKLVKAGLIESVGVRLRQSSFAFKCLLAETDQSGKVRL